MFRASLAINCQSSQPRRVVCLRWEQTCNWRIAGAGFASSLSHSLSRFAPRGESTPSEEKVEQCSCSPWKIHPRLTNHRLLISRPFIRPRQNFFVPSSTIYLRSFYFHCEPKITRESNGPFRSENSEADITRRICRVIIQLKKQVQAKVALSNVRV